ncbi:hypothetical protein COCNU_03G001950 [Cocos nucifera]|uniref:Uncharacterized protein n=1 Tax=Cocos nucifera TaxID=13894 RepID=A0A8K0MYK4_COCNU|nr:hypothetical protein COCNU_03G001950 [Cocos nucifera]
MLKVAKDRTSKGVGEAFARVEAAEKRAQDAEMALVKSTKENSHLLGVNEALTSKMEVLKAQLVEAEQRVHGTYFELYFEVTRYRTKAKMLKVAKDRTSKGVGEAFARVEAAEKRAQDAEMALVKSTKENSHLLGVNEALTSKMEVLKAQLVEAEMFEEGARAVLKDVEKRMVSLQGDMGA